MPVLGRPPQISVHRALGTKDNPPRRDCWPSFLASRPGHFLFVCFQFCFHLVFDSPCGLNRKATLTHGFSPRPRRAAPLPARPVAWMWVFCTLHSRNIAFWAASIVADALLVGQEGGVLAAERWC